MSKTRTEVLDESKKKGVVAGVTTAAAVAAGMVAPVAGAILVVPAAWLSYRWWKHRAENGIRF
jgi:hypothetical protein